MGKGGMSGHRRPLWAFCYVHCDGHGCVHLRRGRGRGCTSSTSVLAKRTHGAGLLGRLLPGGPPRTATKSSPATVSLRGCVEDPGDLNLGVGSRPKAFLRALRTACS